jgi:hypothetical protein
MLGLAFGAAAAALTYAVVRGAERAFFPEPNPVVLIWSDRSPFVWRAIIALYVGGAAVFGGFAWARRDPIGTARALPVALALAIAALAAQVWALP